MTHSPFLRPTVHSLFTSNRLSVGSVESLTRTSFPQACCCCCSMLTPAVLSILPSILALLSASTHQLICSTRTHTTHTLYYNTHHITEGHSTRENTENRTLKSATEIKLKYRAKENWIKKNKHTNGGNTCLTSTCLTFNLLQHVCLSALPIQLPCPSYQPVCLCIGYFIYL